MKKQAITLGRIGILLPIAAIIPFLGILAGPAAMVLLLVSYHFFSKVYEKPGIFKNALIGTIVPIVANIIGGIIIGISVGSAAFSPSPESLEAGNFEQITSILFESGATILGGLIILAGSIIGFYFLFQGLKILAEQSGVKLFRTAGLLYFIGAIGLILFFLGSLVIFVAWIIHIVAYFSIHADEEIPAYRKVDD